VTGVTIRDIVFRFMPEAYADASDGGSLPAPARQIGYACRRRSGLGDVLNLDYVLKGNGGGLVMQYLAAHPRETADWDVVRDARGSFNEPHTGVRVPLSTIGVREYLTFPLNDRRTVPQFSLDYATHGPTNRFGAILYIEKEGFAEQIAAAGVIERWDIAIASCKGYSVHAARELLRSLQDEHGVRVLVAHDFDKAGIGIFDTLGNGPMDIGLRLGDVHDERWGLDAMSEPVTYGREGKTDPRPNMRLRGATDAEIDYLCPATRPPFKGRRVELNALVGRTFIDWLEAKLAEHGVTKVTPDPATLEHAYRRAYERETINRALLDFAPVAAAKAARTPVPANIVTLVTDGLREQPELAWDHVLAEIVEQVVDSDRRLS
jgi:hypothetical protein